VGHEARHLRAVPCVAHEVRHLRAVPCVAHASTHCNRRAASQPGQQLHQSHTFQPASQICIVQKQHSACHTPVDSQVSSCSQRAAPQTCNVWLDHQLQQPHAAIARQQAGLQAGRPCRPVMGTPTYPLALLVHLCVAKSATGKDHCLGPGLAAVSGESGTQKVISFVICCHRPMKASAAGASSCVIVVCAPYVAMCSHTQQRSVAHCTLIEKETCHCLPCCHWPTAAPAQTYSPVTNMACRQGPHSLLIQHHHKHRQPHLTPDPDAHARCYRPCLNQRSNTSKQPVEHLLPSNRRTSLPALHLR
jgi:hypothetical protein